MALALLPRVMIMLLASDLLEKGWGMSLSDNDIKSELSYAYLHAVAARTGFSCEHVGRHRDATGVDAVLGVRERLRPDSLLTDFTIDVQLKATSEPHELRDGCYSFTLKVDQYDRLRLTAIGSPRLLMVLFLPEEPDQWLIHTEAELLTRRCSYWVNLYGAPESPNRSKQTVYLPAGNRLSVEQLRTIAGQLSLGRERWFRDEIPGRT
jgi:hypothetical protein